MQENRKSALWRSANSGKCINSKQRRPAKMYYIELQRSEEHYSRDLSSIQVYIFYANVRGVPNILALQRIFKRRLYKPIYADRCVQHLLSERLRLSA